MTTPTEREALIAKYRERVERDKRCEHHLFVNPDDLLKMCDMLEADAQGIDDLKKKVAREQALGDIHFAERTRLEAQQVAVPQGDWLWGKLMAFCKKRGFAPAHFDDLFAIVSDARAAAPQPPQPEVQQVAVPQEPAAWGHISCIDGKVYECARRKGDGFDTPLYLAAPQPPQPETRKPLTEDVINGLGFQCGLQREDAVNPSVEEFARALESMHSIKEQP